MAKGKKKKKRAEPIERSTGAEAGGEMQVASSQSAPSSAAPSSAASAGDLETRMDALIEKVEAAEASAERVALLKELGALSRNEAGDPEGALEAYVLALCEAPEDTEVVQAVDALATETGRWPTVVESAWEEASGSPAESIELLQQLATWYEERLDSDEGARQCYALIVQARPDDENARQANLRLLEKSGDWQAVLTAIDGEVDNASATRANNLRKRAAEVALFELGNLELAKVRIDALEQGSEDERLLRRRWLERQNDWTGVIDLLRAQAEQASGAEKAELLAEIGALQEDALEDRDAAKSSYEQALALAPEHADAQAGLQRIASHFEGLGGDERVAYLQRELSAAKAKQDWKEAIRLQRELAEKAPGVEQETALDDLLAEAGAFADLEERTMVKYDAADSLLKKASIKHGLAERMRKAEARGQRVDEARMWALYEEAFALDPKHALRAKRLADHALESGDNVAALRFYEAAVREADQLPKEDAIQSALAAADIAHALERKEKEQTLLVKALIYLGDDADVMLRLADLSYEMGEIDEAGEYYGGWLKTGQDPETLTRARLRRAEALINQGDGVGALVLLQKLPDDVRGDQSGVLRAKALEAAQRWGQAVDAWKELAGLTEDADKQCEWLLHAAQLTFTKAKDGAAAEALIRKADPNLERRAARSQLMAVLARAEDWQGLHDLLTRQVEFASSDNERAQFEKTAGFIAMEKLKDSELAEEHFARSLQAIADQGDVKTALESLRPAEKLRELAQTESERATADIGSYGKVPKAPAAPDLSEMGLEEAVSTAEHELVETTNEVVETTHALPPRGATALTTSRFLDEELWQDHIVHEDQDVFLTMLFAVITPAVMAERKQELHSYGIDPSSARDAEQDPAPIAKTLHYVASLAQLPLPALYSKPGSGGGLEFLHTIPPAMGVGEGAEAGGPGQALAFVAARTLSFYRPGHYLRELINSGSELRAWLIAAIRLSKPGFAAPSELEPDVDAAQRALGSHLPESSKKVLSQLCNKLLEHAPSLDLKRWVVAVDLTADRIGFIMSDDLEMATALIEASPAHASVVDNRERVTALTSYAQSHRYYTLRQTLGLEVN